MERTDGQLLEDFVSRKDPDAFLEILRRHQAMVMGVCRRVLASPHDAEDAFQATFLALAQKAGSIRKADSLGSWLHGVALRVASLSRLRARRQRRREREAVMNEGAGRPGRGENDQAWEELRPVLDEELNRLPGKYRAPLVLCYLEGKSNAKAAEELGWPSGTMSRRLAGARETLRGRLVRRGVAVSGGALAALLSAHAAAAAVPPALAASTAQAAGLLAGGASVAGVVSPQVGLLVNGGLKAMMWAKANVAAAMVAATLAVSGGGVLAFSALADNQEKAQSSRADLSENFDRAFALIKTSPGEARWDEIPWTTSLWEGRKRAAAEGKPLFIWAANGNPIGIT